MKRISRINPKLYGKVDMKQAPKIEVEPKGKTLDELIAYQARRHLVTSKTYNSPAALKWPQLHKERWAERMATERDIFSALGKLKTTAHEVARERQRDLLKGVLLSGMKTTQDGRIRTAPTTPLGTLIRAQKRVVTDLIKRGASARQRNRAYDQLAALRELACLKVTHSAWEAAGRDPGYAWAPYRPIYTTPALVLSDFIRGKPQKSTRIRSVREMIRKFGKPGKRPR